MLTGAGGLHAILDVVLAGQQTTHASILKDYQQDVIRGHITHIDLQEVRLDRPIQAQVVVELVGEPAGVKEGGVLSQVTREITVEALPMQIPEHLEIDVSSLAINETLRLADLPPTEGVTYLDDPEETILAAVSPPTVMTAEDEGLDAPEGDEAAADASAAAGEADAAGSPGTIAG